MIDPIIIKQLFSILASISLLLSNISVKLDKQPFLKLGGDYSNLGGVASGSGNFPTSTNNFQDGDVINAGDWNAIENTIGTTNSPTSTTITWKANHPDLTNNASGTLGVAHGGTGTSTTPGNGKLLIGNGTNYSLNNLTAGAGITITNGAGTVILTGSTLTPNLWGSGRDGDITISATTTLARDMYYNTLTVNAGITLYTGNYRIYSLGTITNNGIIDNSGQKGGDATPLRVAGTSTAPTAAGTIGSNCQGTPGGAGGNNTFGAAGVAATTTNVLGGQNFNKGGTGGSGDGGAGGLGGATTTPVFDRLFYTINTISTTTITINATTTPDIYVSINASSTGLLLQNSTQATGGGGGGGGASSGGAGGGAGGNCGGTILIMASAVVNNGQINANGGPGGNGGNAGSGSNNGGGGGGEGGTGGIIILGFKSLTGTGTINANGGPGGNGGTGVGTGTNGQNGPTGATGTLYYLNLNY